MTNTPTRFDLRIPSARTGRLVLPAMSKRRACACCAAKVAKEWVLPNGATRKYLADKLLRS